MSSRFARQTTLRTTARSAAPAPRRSTLPKHEARLRYVEIGELVALEQIRKDSEVLDRQSIPVGPFARLDAGRWPRTTARRAAPSRTSSAARRPSRPRRWRSPCAPATGSPSSSTRSRELRDADEWLDAFLARESARGPTTAGSPPSATPSSGRSG